MANDMLYADWPDYGVQKLADHKHPTRHNLSPVEGDDKRTWTRALGKRDSRYMGPITRAGLKEYNLHLGERGPPTGKGQHGYD